MSALAATPEEIRHFGECAREQCEQLTRASAEVNSLDPAQLAPTLGLIGADYLTAFSAARARYNGAVTALAEVASAISAAAHATAARYESQDTEFASALTLSYPEA